MSDRKTFIGIFIAGLLLTVAIRLGASNPTRQEIFQNSRKAVCLVEFYQNIAAHSEIGTFMKRKQYRIGVLVNPDGLIMVSSDVYPLSLDIMSGSGGAFFSGEPSDFKIKLYDGSEYPAEFVGKDDMARVAFLRIAGGVSQPFPFVRFSSTENLQMGDPIYLLELLGEAYNFEQLFTAANIGAIVSSPRRKFILKGEEPALSAGGLVLNESGEAIGVTINSRFNINFNERGNFDEFQKRYLEIAPSEWFADFIQNPPTLEKKVFRGKSWLGIRMQALTPDLKSYWKVPSRGGIVIDRVFEHSPADRAGLQVGDVIIRVNDQDITIQRDEDLSEFRQLIADFPPESKIEMHIFRSGKVLSQKVTLESAPKSIDLAEKLLLPELGFEVREITRDVLYDNNLPLSTQGVYVYRVDRTAPAGLAGLQIGELITHLNGKPVSNLSEFQKLLQQALKDPHPKIMLQVQRRQKKEFVFVDKK